MLAADPGPAFFLYDLDDPAGPGRESTRGWLGAVGLPGAGTAADTGGDDPVVPHEATVPEAVADRHRLRAATAADLEPIVLAHDGPPAAADALAHRYAGDAAPLIDLRDDGGVRHRLWQVTDPADVAAVAADLGARRAVIADGHHRYAAARDHRAEQPGPGPQDRILALVVPLAPHGLRVSAIHRVLPGTPLAEVAARAEGRFRVEEIAAPDRPEGLLDDAPATLLLVTDGRRWLRLTEPERARLVPEPRAWRELDVALVDVGLGGGAPGVVLRHTVPDALAEAAGTGGVAVLVRATSPETVLDLAGRGVLMPRKSTLFVPKPRTGLVLRCFADQPAT